MPARPRLRRLLPVPVGATALILGLAVLSGPAAHAAGEPEPPPKCFRVGPDGELPVCTWDGSRWSVSYDDGGFVGDPAAGMPSGFAALFVIGLLVGVGVLIWRVSLARQMARESGMDPDRATAVTLLSDDGLDATYLASSLRGPAPAAPSPTSPPPVGTPPPADARPAHERLRELQGLLDDGLVTEEEFHTRRRAVLDSI